MKLIFLSVICLLLLFPVFGQENTDNFHQEGIASWYGIEFAGKPTASGEIFNPDDMTAAHPKLPFGTFLRVTNTHNGKQVIVKVNDRGPFVAARIIDLSERAAEQLDMIVTGTAPVIVEEVNLLAINDRLLTEPGRSPVSTQNVPVNAPPHIEAVSEADPPVPQVQMTENPPVISGNSAIAAVEDGKSYRIQVGAYKNAKYAVDAFEALKNAGLTPAYERYNDLYRVVIAQIESSRVQSVADILAKAGFAEILIKEER